MTTRYGLLMNSTDSSVNQARASNGTRIAVATLHYGAGAGGCGLLKWCYSVAALVKQPSLIGATEAVIIADDQAAAAASCWPRPRIVKFDRELLSLARAWAALPSVRQGSGGQYAVSSAGDALMLMKLQLVSLVEYDVVVYLDSDVDLFLHTYARPPHPESLAGRVFARAWRKGLDAFRGSRTHLLATADPHVPVNGGLFVLAPSRNAYRIGLAALRSRRFNWSHGFELRGRPRDVLPPTDALAPLRWTRMWRRNTWDVVNGALDQGLLTFIYLVALGGADTSYNSKLSASRVHHYFGPHKPWLRTARCLAFYDFLKQPDFATFGRAALTSTMATRCLQRFDEKRACLDADGRSDAACRACERRGDKSTCPERRKRTWRAAPVARCPAATRWWIF